MKKRSNYICLPRARHADVVACTSALSEQDTYTPPPPYQKCDDNAIEMSENSSPVSSSSLVVVVVVVGGCGGVDCGVAACDGGDVVGVAVVGLAVDFVESHARPRPSATSPRHGARVVVAIRR